jgi:hypothetical protein
MAFSPTDAPSPDESRSSDKPAKAELLAGDAPLRRMRFGIRFTAAIDLVSGAGRVVCE